MIHDMEFSDIYFFDKALNKSLIVEKPSTNQLHFLFNPLTFKYAQFFLKVHKEYYDIFKNLKIRFHIMLGKDEEDVLSDKKIMKFYVLWRTWILKINCRIIYTRLWWWIIQWIYYCWLSFSESKWLLHNDAYLFKNAS